MFTSVVPKVYCNFRSDFVQILNFLRNLTVQTENEKVTFFRDIVQRLFALPVRLVAERLVRPLLARFVLLEPSAVEHLMPHLLTPAKGKSLVTDHLIPHLLTPAKEQR